MNGTEPEANYIMSFWRTKMFPKDQQVALMVVDFNTVVAAVLSAIAALEI